MRIRCCGLIVLGVGLTACSQNDKQQEISRYIEQVRTLEPHAIEPIPSFEPLQQFSYPEDQGARSPFLAKVTDRTIQVLQPDVHRLKQPLEAFPLDALKFVGIFEEGVRRWGLIMQPGGQVVRVSVGDYMGQNYGKIIAVKDNSLMIEERVLQEGSWIKRRITFRLDTLAPMKKQAK